MIAYTSYLAHRVTDGIAVLENARADARKACECSLAWRVHTLSQWMGDDDLNELPPDVAERVRRHRA